MLPFFVQLLPFTSYLFSTELNLLCSSGHRSGRLQLHHTHADVPALGHLAGVSTIAETWLQLGVFWLWHFTPYRFMCYRLIPNGFMPHGSKNKIYRAMLCPAQPCRAGLCHTISPLRLVPCVFSRAAYCIALLSLPYVIYKTYVSLTAIPAQPYVL